MPSLSQQPRLSNTQEAIQYIFTLWESSSGMPAWSSPGRSAKLREFARSEPILSGALASMTSKVLSLDWQIVGGRNRVKQYQELLAHAEDGKGWQSMLGRWVQDYLNTDIGGFIELARQGKNGPVVGLYHLDSECVGLTGAVNYPVVYVPKLTSGKLNKAGGIRFRPLDYARIVDMESPDESKFGMGFCLLGDSTVLMADGSYQHIRDLVTTQSDALVMSLNDAGQLVSKPIIGWHANPRGERRMVNLRGEHVAINRGNKRKNTWFTADHPILTPHGYRPAGELQTGDQIVTAAPAPSRQHMALLVGTLLGDSSLHGAHLRTRMSTGHNSANNDWLTIKTNALAWLGWTTYEYREVMHAISQFQPCLTSLRSQFYPAGRKIIPIDLLAEYLSPILLAAWYMDDGWREGGKNNRQYSAQIGTSGATIADVEAAVELLTNAGFACHAVQSRGDIAKRNIKFTAAGSAALFAYIAPYVTTSFRYKLPPESAPFEAARWELGEAVPFVDTVVVDTASRPGENVRNSHGWEPTTVYCIDVADTHNFISSGIVVHNCAVSRAYKAARVLLALYNYDEEKLADMPMPGLVTITGMTMPEVEAAFALYNAHRESREQAVFKGLLWLASQSSPLNPIDAKLVSFAGLPENFDREQTYSLYIYTLALDFGVDAREFWPATQSGATKGEAEVQAQKAKGKGFGQLLTSIEYTLNWNVLPEGIEFRFDRRNDDDDLAREIWRGQTINNIRKLYDPPPGGTMGLIDIDEARRLLVDAQVVPDWVSESDNITLHSQDRTFPEGAPEKVLSEELEEKAEEAAEAAARAQRPAQEPEEDDDAEERRTEMGQKAARAGLGRNEDLVAVNLSGHVQTLWTSRKTFLPPRRELSAQRVAAIAHLQAAGLLITGATKDES